MGVYTADLDLVSERIAQMAAFEKTLEERLSQVQASLDQLHYTWTGQAASAQKAAHAKWSQGAAEMREALADLRKVVEVARTNYGNAADANVAMWNSVK